MKYNKIILTYMLVLPVALINIISCAQFKEQSGKTRAELGFYYKEQKKWQDAGFSVLPPPSYYKHMSDSNIEKELIGGLSLRYKRMSRQDYQGLLNCLFPSYYERMNVKKILFSKYADYAEH